MAPRQEQVNALFSHEATVPEKTEELVPEEELGAMSIDIGNGNPLAIGVPNGLPLERRPEGLDDGDHAGASIGLVGGGGHLTDGFVGEPCDVAATKSTRHASRRVAREFLVKKSESQDDEERPGTPRWQPGSSAVRS